MVYHGTIRNGVIVFDNGAAFPEGSTVKVELLAPPNKAPQDSAEIDPVFRMSELAGDAGIPDLSVNIDHYLYGHPKVTDGR